MATNYKGGLNTDRDMARLVPCDQVIFFCGEKNTYIYI